MSDGVLCRNQERMANWLVRRSVEMGSCLPEAVGLRQENLRRLGAEASKRRPFCASQYLQSGPRRGDGMLTVYKFGPIGGSPDMSPFVIKVETWLRMAKVPYATELGGRAKKPLGKLPTVLDDNRLIADSSVIIDHFEHKFGDPLGEGRLSREDKTMREAMKALFETSLYWVGFCIRWGNDENFEHYKPAMLNYALQTSSRIEGVLLKLMQPVAFPIVRKQFLRQAQAQGTGRHTHREIEAMGVRWWGVVSDHLDSKPYMLGHGPTALDATAYGFLDSYLGAGVFSSQVHDFIASRENLVRYWTSLRRRYWPDLDPGTPNIASAAGRVAG